MVTTKIYLENLTADPSFNFVSRIVGRRGMNVQWIAQQSGADFVTLKGKDGKSSESANSVSTPYIHIVAKSEIAMAKAIYLAKDLIAFVKQEYLAFTARKSAGMTHLLFTNSVTSESSEVNKVNFDEIKKHFISVAPSLFIEPEYRQRKAFLSPKIISKKSLR